MPPRYSACYMALVLCRRRHVPRFAGLLSWCVLLLPAWPVPPTDPEMARLALARDAVARNRGLPDAEKRHILEMYEESLRARDAASQFRAARAAQQHKKAAVEREIASVEQKLRRGLEPPAFEEEQGGSPVQAVSEALERALTERNSIARVLADLTQRSAALTERRGEINQRRGRLRQDEETANDLSPLQLHAGSDAWEAAALARGAARKAALLAEREALAAERETLDSLRLLIPLQRDLAKLKLEAVDIAIESLKARSREALAKEVSLQLERANRLAAEAAAHSASLLPVSRQVSELAHRLWGPSGIILARQQTADLTQLMKLQTQRVKEVGSVMRRRYEAAGRFAPAAEWLQSLPTDLPKLNEVIALRAKKLALSAQLRRDVIAWEERRKSETSIDVQVEQVRAEGERTGGSRSAAAEIRRLLQQRRTLVEELLKNSQELEGQIAELDAASSALIEQLTAIRDFARQRVLWARSVEAPLSPGLAAEAFGWLFWNPGWKTVWRAPAPGWMQAAIFLAFCCGFLARRRMLARKSGPFLLLRNLLSAVQAPALMLLAGWFVAGDESEYGRALKAGLNSAAAILGAALFLVSACGEQGFLAKRFAWSAATCRLLRRDLAYLAPAIALPWFCVAALAEVGNLVGGEARLQGYHNSLGRLCFLVACAGLLALSRHLRGGYRRLAAVLLAAAILLTMGGFYLTALLLIRNGFWTLVLTCSLAVAASLLSNWRASRRRALEADAPQPAASGASEAQVRQLTQFGLGLVWICGVLAIWPGVFPSLTMLDHVRLSSAADSTPLTLLTVLEAILIAAGAVLLIKNVPGLLDFVLLHRFRLHSGSVYASATIARYLLALLGALTVSRTLGIDWTRVQWLAAALTFGIGFGLQDIFANFASGLILLLDRSIRVGDAVTVAEWSGRVSRIQMRATTVTLWDRSEMVVPNKEFITSKLINWTLSLPESRVDVKLGVAYGSDLDLVRKTLHGIAAENANVLRTPPPEVLLTAFGDSAILFELRAFCLYEFGRAILLDQLHTAIHREFAALGIEIPYPRIDIHVQNGAVNRAIPENPVP